MRLAIDKHVKDYMSAKKRLIMLDYDGVLTPFSDYPKAAKPSRETLDLLKKLAGDPRNDVVIVSGRDKKTLDEWFGYLCIGLVAEHGVWIKEEKKDWVITRPLNTGWKTKVHSILEGYVDRVPGSFIEEKEYSLAWHYRKADPELASVKAKELTDNLTSLTASIDLQVLQGSKVIEVRNLGVNKGSAATRFYSKEAYDYVMAVGDDRTDEDMFKALPKTACTIKVGMQPSHARYNLRNYKEIQKLLEAIATAGK